MNRSGDDARRDDAPSAGLASGALGIRPLRDGVFRSDVEAAVELYNRAHAELHGFFPLTPERFRTRVLGSPHVQPDLFLLAHDGPRLVGMVHAAALGPPCHEDGGVVEMIAVDPDRRGEGVGGMLLDAALGALRRYAPPVVDAGGAFPFSPFYATLLDGSERSGVSQANAAALRLFASRGFARARESLVMRLDLHRFDPAGETGAAPPHIRRRAADGTWLDHVFRGWDLFDSALTDASGQTQSRAIYGRMADLSAREGRELYAVFGVHTPEALRGRGYATRHFRRLLPHLRDLGAEAAELHVYADNTPAVRLYRRMGFREIGRTVALRRR